MPIAIFIDSLYSQCGFRGNYFAPGSFLHLQIRNVLALIAQMLLWVNAYAFVNIYFGVDTNKEWAYGTIWLYEDNGMVISNITGNVTQSNFNEQVSFIEKDTLCLVLGLLVMYASGVIFGYVGITLDQTWYCGRVPEFDENSSWWQHTLMTLASLVSLLAQNCVWVGFWDIAEYYCLGSVWRELFYTCVGLCGFWATQSLGASGMVAYDENESSLSVYVILRAFVGICANFIHYCGNSVFPCLIKSL